VGIFILKITYFRGCTIPYPIGILCLAIEGHLKMNKKPDTSKQTDCSKKPIYRIKINGLLDKRYRSWLNNMEQTTECEQNGNQITVLKGPLADQSELRGLMIKIWDLNLTLISVNKIENENMKG
jgi:hypothetical protein